MKHFISKIILTTTIALSSVNLFSQILSMPLNNNTNDVSGHNNHGFIQGTLSNANDRFGNPNSAYHFPGTSSDYIYIPTNISSFDFNITQVDSISISLWAQPENNNSQQYIFAKREAFWTASQTSDFDIQMSNPLAKISSQFGPSYNANFNDYTASNPQLWYHVVLTYVNGLSKLYVNDTLRGSAASSPIDSTASTVIIGKNYKGEIDDINVYHKGLSATEVDQLFKLGSTTGITKLTNTDKNVVIYPNPTSDYIKINNETNNEVEIVVYDLIGKIILIEKTFEKNKQIDLREYKNGIYFVKLSNSVTTTTYKIVKQ